MSTISQQPPLVAYPNTVATNPPPTTITSSHSNGSFGTVFVVLAVIVVVSGIACCLGRICNKRKNKQKPNKHSQQGPIGFRPKEKKGGGGGKGQKERESDLEFGFDKGFPTVRSGPIRNGDPRGFKPPGGGGGGHQGNGHHHMNGSGHFKGESFNPVEMMGPRPGPM